MSIIWAVIPNVMWIYFSSGKINPSHSEIPNFYKYKQIIEFNPITAVYFTKL